MLIETIEEVNTYVESNAGIAFLSLKPSLEAATGKFIKPILGTAFYDELHTLYSTVQPVDELSSDIIALTQRALVNLALYLYVPISEAQLTDAGVRRGHHESAPGAFKYQVKELQKAYLERGFQCIEELIDKLEANIEGDAVALWTSATEFTSYRSLFVRTGREFEQHYSTIRYPRRLYTLLRSSMYNVQELQIATAISQDIYDELKQAYQQPTPALTDEQIDMLNYLKPAIANLTIARGMATLVAVMDENGIHVLSQNADSSSEISKRSAASNSLLNAMTSEALSTGTAWLDKAVKYLNDNCSETVFPTWYALINAEETDAPESYNDNLNGNFSL